MDDSIKAAVAKTGNSTKIILMAPKQMKLCGVHERGVGFANMVMRTKMLSPKLFVLVLMMIFAVAGLLAFVGAAPSPEWDIQTVDSVGNVGSYTSMVLDSSGNPHISYYGDGNLKYVKVKTTQPQVPANQQTETPWIWIGVGATVITVIVVAVLVLKRKGK